MNHNSLVEVYKEYFEVTMLSEKDRILYYLIDKFKDKVSQRLLDKQKNLRDNGRKKFIESTRGTLCEPNLVLDSLCKIINSEFIGCYYRIYNFRDDSNES